MRATLVLLDVSRSLIIISPVAAPPASSEPSNMQLPGRHPNPGAPS